MQTKESCGRTSFKVNKAKALLKIEKCKNDEKLKSKIEKGLQRRLKKLVSLREVVNLTKGTLFLLFPPLTFLLLSLSWELKVAWLLHTSVLVTYWAAYHKFYWFFLYIYETAWSGLQNIVQKQWLYFFH